MTRETGGTRGAGHQAHLGLHRQAHFGLIRSGHVENRVRASLGPGFKPLYALLPTGGQPGG